jgi:N-acetylmuramoyl-L-alanine amidase
MRNCANARAAIALLLVLCASRPVWAQAPAVKARAAYDAATRRAAVLRRDLDTRTGKTPSLELLRRLRGVASEYERLAEIEPGGHYGDDALWQAALLSADAYWSLGKDEDRRVALRRFEEFKSRFPSSSLVRQAASHMARLQPVVAVAPVAPPELRKTQAIITATPDTPPSPPAAPATLVSIRRDALADVIRLTLELEREITFREDKLKGPPRVFVDLENTLAVPGLKDRTLAYDGAELVHQVRVGRPATGTTRVVFDLDTAGRYNVYQLYEPYRVVIDFERRAASDAPQPKAEPAPASYPPTAALMPAKGLGVARAGGAPAKPPPASISVASLPTNSTDTPGATWTPQLPSATSVPPQPSLAADATLPPAVPAANVRTGVSLSRQLGLGISRVVIDAGHGGHDPGARVKGLNEADLVLDVALRLEKLLIAENVTVLLTRRSNVYVPLEQRTAIANREEADLFLSIHANASRNTKARGIETYYLNFAGNPEAERVAARENESAGRTMHNLPEIVKAIALNDKIDESRDFASLVQSSMYDELRKSNAGTKDLGVKQAPFMVLIGARMPSVLAEVSFITHKEEASLLKTSSYRQRIAESLLDGILRYQRSRKINLSKTVASQ